MRFSLFILALWAILASSCYKEKIIYPDPSRGEFNFYMSAGQEERIYEARKERFPVDNPLPTLYYNDGVYGIDRFEIRGESTLNFRRKSFSINMDNNLFYYIEEDKTEREIEEFKLISLVYDYTYIENATAIAFMKPFGLWPNYSFFTEVKLNNHTQGVYLFIEDPVEYYMDQHNATVVFRRNYHHGFGSAKLNEFIPAKTLDEYKQLFNSIYSDIKDFSGEQLYNRLNIVLDLEQYFIKLAIDLILQNGDATDEVFFYTKQKNGREVFGIQPWDYDDLFAEYPHEIGRDWAVGRVFGSRTYSSMEDIIDDVGEKLIFSIEDDLDYKIASDDFLYQKYLLTLEDVLLRIDPSFIESVFASSYNQLHKFYLEDEIIDQSKYDERACNFDLFTSNLEAKRTFLLNRREYILRILGNQKK